MTVNRAVVMFARQRQSVQKGQDKMENKIRKYEQVHICPECNAEATYVGNFADAPGKLEYKCECGIYWVAFPAGYECLYRRENEDDK